MNVLALAAAALLAQQITADQFLSKAAALSGRNRLSLMLSSDARDLMRLVGEAAQHTRATLDNERAAGRPVGTCLPAPGKASVDAAELVVFLRSLPAQERAQSFERAFGRYVARKYPCGAH